MNRWVIPALTAATLVVVAGGVLAFQGTPSPLAAPVTTTTLPPPTLPPTTTTSSTSSTTLPPLPPPVTAGATRSGVFVPGWNTCGTAAGVYYQATFTSYLEAEGVLAHRVNQMRCDDNTPVVYFQTPVEFTVNEITDGKFDEFITEWFAQYFAVCGTDCIIAPMAEANGDWVAWHTDVPAEYHAAYAHLQTLAEPFGETTWAYAPAQVIGWKEYAPAEFDILLPSIFDARGELTALDIIGRAVTMRDYFDVDLILGQTGTVRVEDRDDWIRDLHRLASREGIVGVIMFDCTCPPGYGEYAYPGGPLLSSAVYQEVLRETSNE